jgi:hypothetical protein
VGAFADLADYIEALNAGQELLHVIKDPPTASSTAIGKPFSLWTRSPAVPAVGVAPTTAVAPTRATAGAWGQQNGGAGQLYIPRVTLQGGSNSSSQLGINGVLVIADRLSHQGGLSGTVTTAQTTNLPTAALTRYTTGAGVHLALEIYTAVGGTQTTVTASYTDEAGNTGNTTQAVGFGSTSSNLASQMIPLPLASGDSGVRAVASVTVLATTGTAGNFGVTLYKPLLWLPVGAPRDQRDYEIIRGALGGGLPEILDEACLMGIWYPGVNSGSTSLSLAMQFTEV